MLGLAIGRIGCLMNGCCFGGVCDHPWAITFPADTPPDYTPPYRAQVERGQMYGFTLSSNPDVPPRVLAVGPDSPAGRAGLKRGDRLQSINGRQLSSTGRAYAALEEAFDQRRPAHNTDRRTGRRSPCRRSRRRSEACRCIRRKSTA